MSMLKKRKVSNRETRQKYSIVYHIFVTYHQVIHCVCVPTIDNKAIIPYKSLRYLWISHLSNYFHFGGLKRGKGGLPRNFQTTTIRFWLRQAP